MITPLVISPTVFREAVRSARPGELEGEIVDGLGAPILGTILAKAGELWAKVEQALVAAYHYGVDAAVQLRDDAIGAVEEAVVTAGRMADDLASAILTSAREYVGRLVAGALQSVEATVSIGGQALGLANVSIARTIVVSGSLKASITELVAFTGSGEITIEATYGNH